MDDETRMRERLVNLHALETALRDPTRLIGVIERCENHQEAIAAVSNEFLVDEISARRMLTTQFSLFIRRDQDAIHREIEQIERALAESD